MKIRKPRYLWRFIAPIKLGLRWKVFLRLFFFLIAPFTAAGIFALQNQYESVREQLLWQYLAKMQNISLELELKIKDKALLDGDNPLLLKKGRTNRLKTIDVSPVAQKALLRWFELADAKPFLYIFQSSPRSPANRLLYVLYREASYDYFIFDAKFLTDHLLASERLDPADLLMLYNGDGSPACSNLIETDFKVPQEWHRLLAPDEAARLVPGSLRVLELNGRSYMVMAGDLPGLPLIGVMAKPYEAAMGRLRTTLLINIAVLLVLLISSLIISHLLARNQITTLRTISSFLERIAEHDYGFYPHVPGRDERRPIMRFLNTLRGRLRRYHQMNIDRILLQEAKLNTIVENNRDPLLLLDHNWKVLLKNRRFKSTFETGRGYFVRRGITALLEENEIMPTAGTHGKQFSADFSSEIRISNGKRRTFSVSISEWTAGEINLNSGYLVAFHDITDIKNYELELIEAREQALDASRAKTDFLSHMSHEIRTPLNAILGVSDLLRDTGLNTDQTKYVEMFQKAGNNLLELINDILDFQKVEAGKLQLESEIFNPTELVAETCSLLAHYSGAKNLKLLTAMDAGLPPRVHGDARRLRQVLTNLIGNAIKFTEVGQIEVGVKVVSHAENSTRVRFAVRDTGVGIPPDKQQSVFESFSQVAHGPATVKGTGLGLAITQKLIQLMGGEIGLNSTPGEGSEFYFEIPLESAPQETQEGQQSHVQTVSVDTERPRRVLLAEDNDENRLLFQAYLKNEPDLQVDFAADGRQAVDLFATRTYDIILMDMQMPVLNGYDAAREIRALEENRPGENKIPILALTAFSLKEEIRKCYDAGCTGHILKPVRRKAFLESLREALMNATSRS